MTHNASFIDALFSLLAGSEVVFVDRLLLATFASKFVASFPFHDNAAYSPFYSFMKSTADVHMYVGNTCILQIISLLQNVKTFILRWGWAKEINLYWRKKVMTVSFPDV